MLIKCTLEVVEVVIFVRNSSGGWGYLSCRGCDSEYSKLFEVLCGRLEKCYEYYQITPDKRSLYKM